MSAAGPPIQSSDVVPAAGAAETPCAAGKATKAAGRDTAPPAPCQAQGSAPPRVLVPTEDSLAAGPAARREEAAWFKALLPADQDEFRKRWREREVVAIRRVAFEKHSFTQSALRGGAVFLIGGVMFVTGFVGLLVAVAAGLLLGFLWTYLELGPIRAAVLSGTIFAAIVVASRGDHLGLILAMFGFLIVASLSYMACLSRDFARTDGRE